MINLCDLSQQFTKLELATMMTADMDITYVQVSARMYTILLSGIEPKQVTK